MQVQSGFTLQVHHQGDIAAEVDTDWQMHHHVVAFLRSWSALQLHLFALFALFDLFDLFDLSALFDLFDLSAVFALFDLDLLGSARLAHMLMKGDDAPPLHWQKQALNLIQRDRFRETDSERQIRRDTDRFRALTKLKGKRLSKMAMAWGSLQRCV